MKVWQIMHALHNQPANADVVISMPGIEWSEILHVESDDGETIRLEGQPKCLLLDEDSDLSEYCVSDIPDLIEQPGQQ